MSEQTCRCAMWAQRWTFEHPERCTNCGGMFTTYLAARECHSANECGGTCPKHPDQRSRREA